MVRQAIGPGGVLDPSVSTLKDVILLSFLNKLQNLLEDVAGNVTLRIFAGSRTGASSNNVKR